ncbi:MAG: T9SS type A sorting domain-containing protein, partial [Bacteroidetes bacterium]|nr:T9SS type A sorting domain-containing protein [Bacteroidota bacterium]
EAMLGPDETKLGETVYDLQSNASINNRFYIHEDGTMAAVWTMGFEATAFPDRGTGYNYFDGFNWGAMPVARVETNRCGWPSYAAWGPTGEVVAVHNGVSGMEFLWRETKGSGDWTQVNFLGPAGIEDDITWPRIIASGDNHEYTHLFVNSYVEYEGQAQTLLYSRTSDGGATWDPLHIILDGMGSDYYTEISADDYTLAARGNTVVLLVSSQFHDLFYMRSDDNGDSWDKYIVWEHPYPLWDWNTTIADTFFCVDGSANVAIDPDGKVHVVFGINRVMHPEVGTTYSLFPYVDGVGYWNEDMDPFSNDLDALAPPQYGYANSEMIQDVNYIGWMQDVNGDGEITLNTDIMYYQQHGPSNMPSIFVDEDGYIHVLFVSTTETYEYDVYNYKHLWYRTTHPIYTGKDGFGDFIHLTGDILHIFDESYYPMIGGFDNTTHTLHYIFNTDVTPGLAWSDDHGWQTNNTIYGAYQLPVGQQELVSKDAFRVNIFPNPATETVQFVFPKDMEGNASIILSDPTGHKVKEISNISTSASYSLDVNDLSQGIYFYTVTSGNGKVSGKVVVR